MFKARHGSVPRLLLLALLSGVACAPAAEVEVAAVAAPVGGAATASLIWERSPDGVPRPRPTENGMQEWVEKRSGPDRRRWIAEKHRAAPDVDYKEIERANGLREMARRNALVQSGAQEATLAHWSEVGSKNLAGRMHCAALGPAGGSGPRLYAGSSLGGLWRGNTNGTAWQPLGDNLYGGAHEIVVLPGETRGAPDVVVVATDGGSVHVTRDLGATWETPAGLPALSSVRGLAKLDDAAKTILIYGQFNSGGTKPGVFASVDYGRTFQNRWTGAQNYAGSMFVPRKGAGAVASVYLVHQGKLLTSTNGGSNFTTGFTIDAAADRAVLTGCEAGAPTLYAAVRVANAWKLHRSDNGGTSFTFKYDINDFYESLCASTTDVNRVLFGGLEVYRSTNGGTSFTKLNGWGEYYSNPTTKLHADCFGLHCVPVGAGETWYLSTDGGVYHSLNQGNTVQNLSLDGLGVSQYYSTLTSRTNPALILGGSQDQGYQRGVLQPPAASGPSTPFTQLISGDYGHLTSSDGSHGLVYCTYPGFILVQEGQDNPSLLSPFVDFPAGSVHDWLPAVVADPLDPQKFFFCAEKLYRYTRVSGPTWSNAVHSTHDFLVGSANYMTALAFAPSNAQRAYAVNDKGRLFASTNHGVTWANSSSVGPSQHYFYGNTLDVHPTNELEAVVGGSGYSSSGVYRTLNGGSSWTALGTGMPQTMFYGLAYAEDGSGDVYAATEAGAWRWLRATNQWQNIMQLETPITTYWSVEALAGGEVMRFGTYGRGIWDYDTTPGCQGACWIPYGANLGGANTLTLSSQTAPAIGTLALLDVDAAFGGSVLYGHVFWSATPGALPFAGGTLLVDPIQNITRIAIESNGIGTARFPIPDDPLLVGTSLYFQSVVVDPGQAQGFALSNGLQAVFGP